MNECVVQLNFGERIVIGQLTVAEKGTASKMRTVQRVRIATGIDDLPEEVRMAEIRRKDGDLTECKFSTDAWEWLVDTFTNKQDWSGQWAPWVVTLADKINMKQIATDAAKGVLHEKDGKD